MSRWTLLSLNFCFELQALWIGTEGISKRDEILQNGNGLDVILDAISAWRQASAEQQVKFHNARPMPPFTIRAFFWSLQLMYLDGAHVSFLEHKAVRITVDGRYVADAVNPVELLHKLSQLWDWAGAGTIVLSCLDHR